MQFSNSPKFRCHRPRKCSARGHWLHLFGDIVDTFRVAQIDGGDLMSGKEYSELSVGAERANGEPLSTKSLRDFPEPSLEACGCRCSRAIATAQLPSKPIERRQLSGRRAARMAKATSGKRRATRSRVSLSLHPCSACLPADGSHPTSNRSFAIFAILRSSGRGSSDRSLPRMSIKILNTAIRP